MNEAVEQKNKRLVLKLLLLIIGMVGFCFALIPLYDVLTDMSGINGKLEALTEAQVPKFSVDKTRLINLDLITSVGKDTPVTFVAENKKLQIHPGQFYDVQFTVQNSSAKSIKVHASPSVTPGLAAAFVKLVDCFCFEKQYLEAGEVKQLKLRFAIDPKLPVQYKYIALAQQFFKSK